ncbi:MAG: MurR/RpiR family transcriptional regulator [Lactobacillus sp.]|nr:MAG: MurR/RpiR family transcriptional regulator [Lactobacillus sp.]
MTKGISVVDAILATYANLSVSEKRIANFIINNQDRVSLMNAYEIATESDTSRATMSRFVRSLGYDNFAQLRVALARDEGHAPGSEVIPEGHITLDDVDASLGYILDAKVEELRSTAAMIDRPTLKKAVNSIRSSELTMVAAAGNTITIAENASYKLWQAGYRAAAPSSTDGAVQLSLQLTNRDCLVVLSSSGYSKRLIPVMDNANDAGASIIIITSNDSSDLAKRADLVIRTATRDRMLSDLHFSQNSINFIIEVLFLFLSHESQDVSEKNRMFWKSAKSDIEPQSSVTVTQSSQH